MTPLVSARVTDLVAKIEGGFHELRGLTLRVPMPPETDVARDALAELSALAARAEELQRERDDYGPYFARDMARIVGLPDDAWMDAIAARIRNVVAGAARAEEAERRADTLEEAIASALTSLGTGPLKDGYAYAVLDAALASVPPAPESTP